MTALEHLTLEWYCSRLSADLHSPGSADNEDDGGVAQHSNKGDGAVEN